MIVGILDTMIVGILDTHTLSSNLLPINISYPLYFNQHLQQIYPCLCDEMGGANVEQYHYLLAIDFPL